MLGDTTGTNSFSAWFVSERRGPGADRFRLDATSDEELIARLGELVAGERETLAEVLCHIAEIDARRLYLHYGCSSMFAYATAVLGLSEAAAYHRIGAARVARRHPEIFDDVAAGRLHVSGICVLASHLGDIGGEALLDAARGRTTREIRELCAAARPERQVPDSITPIDEERIVVRFTARVELQSKLEEAKALLSHSVTDGKLAEVFERALDTLIEKTRRRRFAETDSPRVTRPSGRRTRHIPAEVRREVEERDQGRCTFVGVNGRRCEARGFAQFHHVNPYGRDGEHSADNVVVMCAAHNALLAEAEYGAEYMAEVTDRLSSKRAELPPPAVDEGAGRTVSKRPAHLLESALGAKRADVVSGLVNLGFRPAQARRAIATATLRVDAPIEDLLVAALRQLA